MRATHRLRARGARSVRIVAATAVLVCGPVLSAGPAAAGVDSSTVILDSAGRTVEAVQADTRIDFVPPLDGNPLTREWFHDGAAAFQVTGPDAENWHGRITLGYQVGYPATVTGRRLRFQYSTPGLGVDLGGADGGLLEIDSLIPRRAWNSRWASAPASRVSSAPRAISPAPRDSSGWRVSTAR